MFNNNEREIYFDINYTSLILFYKLKESKYLRFLAAIFTIISLIKFQVLNSLLINK